MLMDPMGGIVMTNDGNAILREVMESEIVLFYLSHYIGNQTQKKLCILRKSSYSFKFTVPFFIFDGKKCETKLKL